MSAKRIPVDLLIVGAGPAGLAAAIAAVGERIAQRGLPQAVAPLVCGFAGYGNVYRGASEIIDPAVAISSSKMMTFFPLTSPTMRSTTA